MRRRLDAALVAAGLARSRTRAQELIAAGSVTVDGVVVTRASQPVDGQALTVTTDDRYVSRAAHKLIGALDASGTQVAGRALDVGASTGGFTQVLLERGCSPVFAIDVGHGQLAPELRADPRVVVREGLHARDLTLTDVGGAPVDVLVADVSFISLTHLWSPMLACLAPDGVAIVLVKPQFEVGREALGAGGVVRDDAVRAGAIRRAVDGAVVLGWRAVWEGESTLAGQDGNREHVVVLRRDGGTVSEGPARVNP